MIAKERSNQDTAGAAIRRPSHLSTLLEKTDDPAERRRFLWWNLGFLVLNLGLLLMAISNRLDWPHLGVYVLFAMISAPFLLAFLVMIRGTPLTGVALIPSTIVAAVYLAIPEDSSRVRLEDLPIQLPVVLIGSVAWSFVARWLLNEARKRRQISHMGTGDREFLNAIPVSASDLSRNNVAQGSDG